MKIHFIAKRIFLLMFGISLCLFTACQKDDSPDNETIENDDPVDPAEVGGRFSNNLSCTVISVPGEVGLNSYYKKYLNCSGIPIIGSDAVPDEALMLADETLEFMLTGLSSIKAKLISDGNYIALIPEGETLSSLPEAFPNSGGESTGAYTWQGSGSGQLRALASDVSSLLCNPDSGYGHTLVHEIAHMIHIGGILRLDTGFQSQLESAYNNAMSSGKWNNTYASTNPQEYLAEATTIWYGVNWIGPEGGDGFRNEIGTRAQLQSYDASIYNLLNSKFNDLTNLPGCRIPVISDTTVSCPNTIADIDGNVYEIVNIGPLCWLKENLNTTHYNDGTTIPNLTDNNAWQNTTSGAWGSSDNDPSNDVTYGKLYNGYALSSGKLCPEGWHVPGLNELQALVNYGGGDYTSYNLRATTLWNPSDYPGTDTVGFSALPAGSRSAEGGAGGVGNDAFFGSTTTPNTDEYYSKNIFHNNVYAFNGNPSKNMGTSCRCVKDN